MKLEKLVPNHQFEKLKKFNFCVCLCKHVVELLKYCFNVWGVWFLPTSHCIAWVSYLTPFLTMDKNAGRRFCYVLICLSRKLLSHNFSALFLHLLLCHYKIENSFTYVCITYVRYISRNISSHHICIIKQSRHFLNKIWMLIGRSYRNSWIKNFGNNSFSLHNLD